METDRDTIKWEGHDFARTIKPDGYGGFYLFGSSQSFGAGSFDMILTEGNFKKKKWICMGVAFNDHYVSVWFAQRGDRSGEPELCSGSDSTLLPAATSDTIAKEVTYYLIFGSFSQLKDAREAVKRLSKNGFENAGTIKSEDKYRVYLDKYNNLKEAMFAKQNLPYTYREAWVYKE